MFYSPSTNGFYHPDVHDVFVHTIPDDIIELPDEKYRALMDGQSQGKIIKAGEDGNPILIDPPKYENKNADILSKISALEKEVTPRRIREAFTDATWIIAQEEQIAKLRKKIK